MTEYDPAEWIAAQSWRQARTPRYPHSYVVLQASTDPEEGRRFARWLSKGETGRFAGTAYRYRVVDGHRYWVSSGGRGRVLMINRTAADAPFASEDEAEDWWTEAEGGQLRLDV